MIVIEIGRGWNHSDIAVGFLDDGARKKTAAATTLTTPGESRGRSFTFHSHFRTSSDRIILDRRFIH